MARRWNQRSWLVAVLPWVGSCAVLLAVVGILRAGYFMFVVEAWLAFWVWYLVVCSAKAPSARARTDAMDDQPEGH
jgi:hypothetical protein